MSARTSARLLLLVLALSACGASQATAAAPPARSRPALDGSILTKVPHDASFFVAALRTSEHLDALRGSAAYRALKKSPAYALLMQLLQRTLEERGLPPAWLDRFFSDRKPDPDDERSENEELLDLLLGAAGDEAFVYGGRGWTDLASLFRHAAGAGLSGGAEKLEVKSVNVFDALEEAGRRASRRVSEGKQALRVPELVIGLRTREAKKIAGHVARLEKELAPLLAFDRRLEGRLKREGGLLTLRLDGSFVPWEELEFSPYADKDAVAAVLAHLRKATLVVSLGVTGDYVLFAIGPTALDLDRVRQSESLAARPELRPLAGHDAKKVMAVAYVSKDFLDATLGPPDWDAAEKSVTTFVRNNVADERTRKGIEGDVAGLLAALRKRSRGFGARTAHAARTEAGLDLLWHDHGDHAHLRGQKSTLLESAGGDPLFAAARSFPEADTYAALSKHGWSLYAHLEALFQGLEIDDEHKKAYEKHVASLLPALRKLDDAVAKHLDASKGRAEVGIVVDAGWTSKRWHKSLPEAKRPLPMFEPALVLGVGDRDRFVAAAKESPLALVDLYDRLRATDRFATLPELKWREPKKVASGKRSELYAWPNVFVNGDLDEQVLVSAAVGPRVAALSPSQGLALSLLRPTPLRLEDGPLRARRDALLGGMVLNVPELLDVVLAWADAAPDLLPKDGAASSLEQVARHLRGVVAVLKCVGQVQSATCLDGPRKTTHLRIPLEDLGPSPEPRR